jgi:pSer/pThr/pTyr-binding forkhead associated (FHA) protein
LDQARYAVPEDIQAAFEPASGEEVVLRLSALNNSFDSKSLVVPSQPSTRITGRRPVQEPYPISTTNGIFSSRAVSQEHAGIWAGLGGRVWIRDLGSKHGTYVNGIRLSQSRALSINPRELQRGDILELGIDIFGEDGERIRHPRIQAKVEHAGPLSMDR